MADFTWKQGDTGPPVTDTLTYSDGTPVPLQGATVAFTMRTLTASAPITVTGTTTVTDFNGAVQFTPSTQDTNSPAGAYMANWLVTFQSGQVQTFPTQGYLWGVIEPNLASEGQQLVSLPDLKEYLGSFGLSADRSHDAKLLGFIQAATPIIENIAGPIIVRTFEEWHDGGHTTIRLLRRPSTALGTSPVLNLLACSEYNGPIEWPLAIIDTPAKGQLYSCMLDGRLARVVRRTAGGGVQPFPAMPQAVHVLYQAGQQTVPWNVREATLEAIRVNYETTLPTGTGSRTIADEDDRTGPPLGFYLPRRCLELASPNRRHPSIA